MSQNIKVDDDSLLKMTLKKWQGDASDLVIKAQTEEKS